MKTLGIDFGTKKVGLAISDENGHVAFPLAVFPNDKKLMAEIQAAIEKGEVEELVLGESVNFAGEPNPVMKKIHDFREQLKEKTGLAVHYEKEFLTSKQARNICDSGEMNDACAAAIILQSFLDKKAKKC